MEVIYDFETLSQNAIDGVVLNVAILKFDPKRFTTDPYTYEDLVDRARFYKFDVQEQVQKYGRKIQKGTLDWWKDQSKEAQKQLAPNELDDSIERLYDILTNHVQIESCDKVWTRGNSFDPVFVDSILQATGKPFLKNWWAIRDVRSYLDGLLYGSDIDNKFVPEEVEDKFIGHDSRHDVAMDVYRMQYVIGVLNGEG
jgi:hypothetical protein